MRFRTAVVWRTAQSMRRLRSLALPTLSGVLYFLSWIGFGIWPLAFVCFLPLVLALRDATPGEALRRGAWFGFIAHLGGYTWVIHLLRVFAFAPLPLAFLGYVLLCAVQGLLFGVFAWALRRGWTATGWPLAVLLPVALVATEFAYPLLFQSYTGVALMPVLPLVQIAEVGGTLLLSALQAVVNGALFAAIVGAMRVEDRNIWNSALVIDDSGRIGDHYDKIQLLAFGEYIPGGEWFPQIYRWSPLASHLTRGASTAP